eukprot:2788556-Amphidinium_carterae.1
MGRGDGVPLGCMLLSATLFSLASKSDAAWVPRWVPGTRLRVIQCTVSVGYRPDVKFGKQSVYLSHVAGVEKVPQSIYNCTPPHDVAHIEFHSSCNSVYGSASHVVIPTFCHQWQPIP